MADIIEVSEAVIARLSPVLPGWSCRWYEPQPIPLPALCVLPDPAKFADYQQVTGGYTKWGLRLGLYVSANDEESARRKMADLTDPDGPLHSALRDDEIEDALSELCGMDISITTGKGWNTIRRNKVRYLYADLGLTVGTN